MDELDWNRLVGQIRNGECTPFLGAGACSGTLPTGRELSLSWADSYRYPFDNSDDLAQVMQYVCVIERDAVTVKQRVTYELAAHGAPDFDDPMEPHALLARYPMTVYLTTNYDDYMVQALRRQGKAPTTAICPWYRGSRGNPLTSLPPSYEPASDAPLVYHLHGSLQEPRSLVITEQDYIEFLINLVMDRGMDDQKVVPLQVLPALTLQPLLFIGYSLRDWSFRMLFHGLVRSVADVQRRRHVSVQLPPPIGGEDSAQAQRARNYLTEYFQQLNISVFWGTASEFCAELAERMESA